jgi:hypothetical protein
VADNDTNNTQEDRPPQPNPALKSLDVMVGTWELESRESGPAGEIQGRPTFEWMEGGFYLVQRVDLDYLGHRVVGVEYIGYDEDNEVLRSYFFSNDGPFGPSGGIAPEYTSEVGDDTLTIWFEDVGSPVSFKGKFSDERNTITGRWERPGGDYEATMTRVEPFGQDAVS